jgi:imidazole glycerol-phosphate synthase subunit HisH
MIIILDYGLGNPKSVLNRLFEMGVRNAKLSKSKEEIRDCSHLILPGVGAFDEAMSLLESLDLVYEIRLHANKGKPILGICLGMQLMGVSSEEGTKAGLGLIDFKVKKFPQVHDLKVPHMGWNSAKRYLSHYMNKDLGLMPEFYFSHSYYVEVNRDITFLTTNYYIDFSSGIAHKNIIGVQFHPEKSHINGYKILASFVGLL